MKRLLILVLFIAGPCYALPNPASVYCIHHGGTLNVTGNLSGICLFPDHSYCEEWSYFRGNCRAGKYFLPEKKRGMHYCVKYLTKKNPLVCLCKDN